METKPQATEEASPLKRLALAAAQIVYTREIAAGLLQMVQASPDPAQGIAQAAMTVMQQLGEKVKGLDPRAVFVLAPMLVGMIAELAGAAKFVQPEKGLLDAALAVIQQQIGGGQPQEQAPQEQQPMPQGRGMLAQQMMGS